MEDKEAHAGTYSKLQPYWKPGQGGFRGVVFIFILTALENMGFVANMVSLVLYFLGVMHFGISGSANTLTVFMGATFFLTLLGGFISDNYLTRFTTCLIFGAVELLALMLMTIQAHYTKLKPEPCPTMINCEHLKGGNAVMLYATLCLLALGAGGVRGCLPALGGDQFNAKDPKERESLATYFNWLLLCVTIGAAFGVTFIVYLSSEKGHWDLGFFICLIGALLGFIALAVGKPFYRLQSPGDSPMTRVVQVMVVAYRNRSHPLPEKHELYEISDKETLYLDEEKIPNSNQFRFLDKACILEQGSAPDRWRVCTVTQVEEVKILIRLLPILASTILMNTCLAQLQTFSVQQGRIMNRFLGSLEVPAASVPVIPLVFMTILIPIYEYIFVPFARKITNHPSGITQLQRVGVGLVLSVVSMGVAGIVEVKRRNQSIKNPTQPISLFWLSYQYGIFGIADMFTLVGMLEFFYKEAPVGLRSLSTSFTFLSMSMGSFLSTFFVEVLNSVTRRVTKSKKGWLTGMDLNKSNLDLFYWFLAILSFLNFVIYLFCAHWYKYKKEDPKLELNSKEPVESRFSTEENVEESEARVHNGSSTPAHNESAKESEEKREEQ